MLSLIKQQTLAKPFHCSPANFILQRYSESAIEPHSCGLCRQGNYCPTNPFAVLFNSPCVCCLSWGNYLSGGREGVSTMSVKRLFKSIAEENVQE